MGLPEIIITFSHKAKTFIKRSSRGMVLLIFKDDTKGQALTPYESFDDVVEEDWQPKNYDYLRMAFTGQPNAVVVVRLDQSEGATIKDTIVLFEDLNFDWLAYPESTPADAQALVEYIKKARASKKKCKAVLSNIAADHEGIVNFVQNRIAVLWNGSTEVKEYTAAEYTVRIAGILAGLSLTVSSTYRVLDEIVDLEGIDKPDVAIDEGKLIVIFDGEQFKIGRGVTSLTTVTEEQPEDFKKIKIVEGADLIRTDIISTFEADFIGRVNNTYDNKQVFVGAVNDYFQALTGTVLNSSQENYIVVDAAANKQYLETRNVDTSKMTLQQIKEANTGSTLFVTGQISMLDAMEDLHMNLMM